MHAAEEAEATCSESPQALPAGRRLPAVDPQRCTGCGRCVAACEPHLLSLEVLHWRKRSVLSEASLCTGCSACAVVCPFHAIAMHRASPQSSCPPLQTESEDAG